MRFSLSSSFSRWVRWGFGWGFGLIQRGVLLAVGTLFSLILLWSLPHPGQAIDFTPPDRGAPGNVLTDAGGVRFSGDIPLGSSAPGRDREAARAPAPAFNFAVEGQRMLMLEGFECPLTAIVPDSNYGLTLAAYPRFFFHMPPYPGDAVAFRLETEAGDRLYATEFVPQPIDGTFEIALPSNANLPPLAFNQMYHWTFSILNDNEADFTVSGGVMRVEPTPAFAQRLATAQRPISRIQRLAAAGIWFDAIAGAADLVRSDRTNASYERVWDGLVRSIGLDKMAERDLL